MLLRKEYSQSFLEDKLEEYKSTYDDVIKSNILDTITLFLNSGVYNDQVISELTQFYHEYGLIDNKLNVYYLFRDALKEIYSDLQKRKVVDVGAGQVPQLARELAKISDEEVVAVDRIITQKNNNISNLLVMEGEFNDKTTLGERNLLVGYYPCEATKDIIEQSAKNDVDFAVVVCDCTYMSDYYGRLESWQRFLAEVDETVSKSNLGDVHVSNIAGRPLIYTNKRRK